MLIKGTRVSPSLTYRLYEVGSRDLGVLAFSYVYMRFYPYAYVFLALFFFLGFATVVIDVNLTFVIKKNNISVDAVCLSLSAAI